MNQVISVSGVNVLVVGLEESQIVGVVLGDYSLAGEVDIGGNSSSVKRGFGSV